MKASKPDIRALQDSNRYELLAELDHEDMIPFVLDALKRRNPVIRFFYAVHISAGILALGLAAWQICTGRISWTSWLGHFFSGLILGSSLIIPIHEAIHGIGYWVDGARKIRFGGNWKKLYWYAAADEWVISGLRYSMVAMLPFALITILGIFAIFYASLNHQWLIAGVIIMHGVNCAGDFAVSGFCWENRNSPLYTYDLLSQGRSFFFIERKTALG